MENRLRLKSPILLKETNTLIASFQLNLETLLLSKEDVKSVLTIGEVIPVVEKAFREKAAGMVQMPPKTYLFYKEVKGDLRTMPCYLPRLGISSVKIVNYHVKNRGIGLPNIMATILLIDPKTGFPLAIMDGSLITAMRTGAASAVASRCLGRKDARSLGIIGAGTQARTQLAALNHVLRLENVLVHDKIVANAESFIRNSKEEYLNLEFKLFRTVKEVVEKSDILVTITPSREVLVKTDWVRPGMHINGMGADSPEKHELDPMIFRRARVMVDDREQAFHSGDLADALAKGIITGDDISSELGEVLDTGRVSYDEITLFLSTGMGIQDAVTADLVYRKALDKKVGHAVNLFT